MTQLTCCLDNKPHNIARRKKRAEQSRHKERILLRKIQANRKKYPLFFKLIDSDQFQSWWVICTGKPWPKTLEADVEDAALKLNAMQLVYGPIPE